MAQPNGYVIYRGPSMLDGAPIVVVATGFEKASKNGKTGDMIQTWILREDVTPTEAVNSGADASICGACPHRGEIVDGRNVNRSCYVTVFQAPLNVFKSYLKGNYPTASSLSELGAGRFLRLGSYGDPAAVPLDVWTAFTSKATGWNGYTHQWRTTSPDLARFCMASADSAVERMEAKILGYRTFRVRGAADPVLSREVVCPASEEAGKRTDCASCRACGGTGAKAKADMVIAVHGAVGKVNAHARRAA